MEKKFYEENENYDSGIVGFVREAAREKLKSCIARCALFGGLFVMFVLFIMFAEIQPKINEARGYSGAKPTYDEYEKYVLNQIYRFDSEREVYYISCDPNSEEFHDWVYKKIESRPNKYAGITFISSIKYIQTEKNSENYREVCRTAERVFEEVVNERTAAGNKVANKVWLEFLVVFLITGGVCTGIVFWYRHGVNSYIPAAKNGEYRLEDAVLIGREEYRTKNRHSYYIEAETASGE